MDKGCRIVTIKEIIPLFKGEEMANAIEFVSLEEIGNQIVAQKGVYKSSDRALFIQPDFCLSDLPIFQEYLTPGSDPKKCRLGSKNRIRAIKFNLHTGNNAPVYSYGILISGNALKTLRIPVEEISDEKLGIVKWEEPEPVAKGNQEATTPFPSNMYQTDEENINNVINDIEFPILLIGTEKVDGSSITIWYKNGKSGIASRKLGRPLTYKKITGYKKPNIFLKILQLFGYKYDGNIIESVESENQFAVAGKPYLKLLEEFCSKNAVKLALRGELVGKGAKGSGNPNNPKAKEESHIEFFGIDDYSAHTAKLPYSEVKKYSEQLGLLMVKEYFQQTFNSKEEIFETCQRIFDEEQKNGRIIEGIVLRNPTQTFSVKVMNLLYDSKK
jgi:RNA ligase (TIGR02306 family)